MRILYENELCDVFFFGFFFCQKYGEFNESRNNNDSENRSKYNDGPIE